MEWIIMWSWANIIRFRAASNWCVDIMRFVPINVMPEWSNNEGIISYVLNRKHQMTWLRSNCLITIDDSDLAKRPLNFDNFLVLQSIWTIGTNCATVSALSEIRQHRWTIKKRDEAIGWLSKTAAWRNDNAFKRIPSHRSVRIDFICS